MTKKNNLAWRMIRRSAFGLSATMALLFLPAGTIDFWQAWVLVMISDIVPVFWLIYFYKHAPELMERRLLKKDTTTQRVIIQCWRALVIVALGVAGFDHRFGWSTTFWRPVPLWLEMLSFALIGSVHLLHFEVLKANRFAASVIRTERGLTLIESGPYAIVRHPMYFASMVYCILVPLALGSFAAWPAGVVLRILEEEKFLRENLPGYSEYCQKTRYRLLPSIW
jgi:protein-S-isoprenylcysteine O-methyltransferase Ste14